jgi:hypothetical protein
MTMPAAPAAALGTTARRPALDERMEQLVGAIETLDSCFAQLRDRLQPVLADSTPEPGKLAGADVTPGDSWLTSRLQDATARLLSMAASVDGLTRRVDL